MSNQHFPLTVRINMTAIAGPSAPHTRGRIGLAALFFFLAVTLGACSSASSDDAASASPFPTKDAISPGEDGDDEPTDDATPPSELDSEDEGADDQDSSEGDSSDEDSDDRDDDTPQSPPGTINDLEDIIGNERDEMLGSPSNGSLMDRFVVALLADSDGLEISEADARCAAQMLDEGLSATSFELLVANLEMINEIEDGNQFTDAELTVISESFANCIDFRPLVDEVVADEAALGSLVTCLAAEIGVDGVEALLLFEVLGENADRLTTPILLIGLEVCPAEARAAIDAAILDEFLLADAPKIEACLAEISDDDLRPFFETRAFNELIGLLREQCLF